MRHTSLNIDRFTDRNIEWKISSLIRRKIELTPSIQAEAFYIVYQLSLRKDFSWYHDHAITDVVQLCHMQGFNTLPDFIAKDDELSNELLDLSVNVDPEIIKSLILNFGEAIFSLNNAWDWGGMLHTEFHY